MQTEAQRRATSNYRKKVKQLTLRFIRTATPMKRCMSG